MRDKIKEIETQALGEIETSTKDAESLEALRVKYLGRKGIVTELFKKMGGLSIDEKRDVGQLLNGLKNVIASALDEKLASASTEEEIKERIDITTPGISPTLGKPHPVTKTIYEICDISVSLGCKIVEGPEIETEYYNFETLNIPLEHPSRDAFDTFYVKSKDNKHLLRSHTSPVQTRFMEKNKPPFSIVVPGKVFRPDATDASHLFMFHQIEGLVVGDDIRF